MPRRKPISGKQRKEQLQEKRAIKRGDIEKPTATNNKRRPFVGRSQAQLRARVREEDPAAINASAKIESTRKLQSAFKKVSPEFLALWKEKASNDTLPRPIPGESKYFPIDLVEQPHSQDLTTPKRPKWRYEMTKKEVERNEEGMFEKWKLETEEKVNAWRYSGVAVVGEGEEAEAAAENALTMRSPTFYEQNLEVWRQLWRVTELSSILLVLLDSRCPPLHYPPSLHAYLTSQRPPRKIILVLTKIDIVGEDRVNRWKAWLKGRYPDAKIVGVESYRIQLGKGSRVKHLPHIPPQSLSELIDAMEQSHQELLAPPDTLQSEPEKLAKWQPRVRKSVNWEVVRRGEASTNSAHDPVTINDDKGFVEEDSEDGVVKEVTEPLTVGLIGQPNVGKSSLLNALFGTIKVRASRTPGKTKHFQTLFWSPEIRLVDCPGLVLPNLVPMELQVLSSILPISQVASISSCIYFAATLLPLERIFNLTHPGLGEGVVEDKRTWRDGMPRRTEGDAAGKGWTAMDILTAYADLKGWVTAKAGRPDVNRAGNAILRALAEGRVRWAFEPPNLSQDRINADDLGNGIWLQGGSVEDESSSDESDEESEGASASAEEVEEEEDDGEEDVVTGGGRLGGMFGALSLQEEGQEESSEGD